MRELVLLGPFLTRADAAARSGLSPHDIAARPDLLRIGKPPLDEAYFAFQFGPTGIRRELGAVVLALKGRCDDLVIADWLLRPNPRLRNGSPLTWLREGGDYHRAVEAARDNGPGQVRQDRAGSDLSSAS